MAETASRFGRLDILVNNAGMLLRGPVDAFSLADFDRMLAINVRAVFVAVQSAVAHMGAGGRIITVGSVTADRSGFPGASVYSMTKAAVAALTRGLARDLGSRGITVNTVQPGPTETDMNPDENIRAVLRPMLALGRIGKDSEIASLIAYLARSEASFVTGAVFTEKIFGWHGMGEWVVQGISTQDTNIIAAITVFSGATVLLAGLLSDVIYAALDPRVRVS